MEGHREKEGLDLVGHFAPPHPRGAERLKGQNVRLPYTSIHYYCPCLHYSGKAIKVSDINWE